MTNKRRAAMWLALTAAAALVVLAGPVGAQGSLAELLRNIVQNSVTLTANRIVVGNGTSTVTILGSLGTATTVLHGNAGGAPSFGAVSLTADVTGVLPIANMATGTPNGSKFIRDDGVLATPAGGGDVSGPGVAVVDGHLAVWDGTSGTAIKSGGAPGGGLSTSTYLQYREEQTQNTAGGTFTTGAWRTRTLTTEVADVGGLGSLATNQITLTAGTYWVIVRAPAYSVNAHQARLQNVTDTATVLIGQTSQSPTTVAGFSIISGTFTIGASKALEVQHSCETTKTTNGFGVQGNFTTEVYTVVEFWKIG